MRWAHAPGARREADHEQGDGQQRGSRLEGRVAERELQLEDQQEERPAEGGVDGERGEVGPAELAVPEEGQREHGSRGSCLHHHEQPEHHDARHPDDRAALDQRVGAERKAGGGRHRAGQVQAGRAGRPALGDVTAGDQHAQRERQVDEERQAPRDAVDQVAAHERTDGSGDAAEPRPHAHRGRPVIGVERRRDDGQAAGDEQGGAHPLHRAGGDEDPDVRRQAAQDRGGREAGQAQEEHALAAVPVAERAAEQHERAEGDEVGVHHPLQLGGARVEVLRDGGQGDVDDRAVEEGDPGAEHRREEDPPGGGRAHAHASRLRTVRWGPSRCVF